MLTPRALLNTILLTITASSALPEAIQSSLIRMKKFPNGITAVGMPSSALYRELPCHDKAWRTEEKGGAKTSCIQAKVVTQAVQSDEQNYILWPSELAQQPAMSRASVDWPQQCHALQ